MFGNENTRMRTSPIPVRRSRRRQEHRILSSLPSGRMVPLAAVPLLREDALRGRFALTFEMSETAEVLMNAVNVRVMAYVVPNLAFDRFTGMDGLNRSYRGEPPLVGQPVVPWFVTQAAPAHGANLIHKYLGLHHAVGSTVNMAYVEAYNKIWNFRAKNRSPKLTQRTGLDTSLAPAFWMHQQFAHIVPDFDQALIEGEVPLQLINGKLPVRGIGLPPTAAAGTSGAGFTNAPMRESTGANATYSNVHYVGGVQSALSANQTYLTVKTSGTQVNNQYTPDIWAELTSGGISISLANIQLATKTAAFARMRTAFNGLPDEYLIDLLMDGITIPDQYLEQPILLYDDFASFGMSKRYASDGTSLTKSVVNGLTMLSANVRVPRLGCGGIMMVVAEVLPDQLFERQADAYLHCDGVDDLPAYLRDELDPEKVQAVANREIDVSHGTPAGVFGYAPLNHKWLASQPRVGGKFYRPSVDGSFDEVRQRIWSIEVANPTLGPDFYIASTVNSKPFVVTNADPFDVLIAGETIIEGNTVFGPLLMENTNDYEKVSAEAPTVQVDKSATVVP